MSKTQKPDSSYKHWLLPFITILSDGKAHTRSEIISLIVDQMKLSEEQRQARFSDDGGLIVLNQAAWCDVFFCKAGFVVKDASSKDNMQHVFRITDLGLQEFKQNADQINSAYLRSFWK